MLDAETLLALHLALGSLRPAFVRSELGERLEALVARVEARLTPDLLPHFSALSERLTSRPSAPPDYAHVDTTLAAIGQALLRGRTLRFAYRPLHREWLQAELQKDRSGGPGPGGRAPARRGLDSPRGSPARAGIDPLLALSTCQRTWLPRTRGDRP